MLGGSPPAPNAVPSRKRQGVLPNKYATDLKKRTLDIAFRDNDLREVGSRPDAPMYIEFGDEYKGTLKKAMTALSLATRGSMVFVAMENASTIHVHCSADLKDLWKVGSLLASLCSAFRPLLSEPIKKLAGLRSGPSVLWISPPTFLSGLVVQTRRDLDGKARNRSIHQFEDAARKLNERWGLPFVCAYTAAHGEVKTYCSPGSNLTQSDAFRTILHAMSTSKPLPIYMVESATGPKLGPEQQVARSSPPKRHTARSAANATHAADTGLCGHPEHHLEPGSHQHYASLVKFAYNLCPTPICHDVAGGSKFIAMPDYVQGKSRSEYYISNANILLVEIKPDDAIECPCAISRALPGTQGSCAHAAMLLTNLSFWRNLNFPEPSTGTTLLTDSGDLVGYALGTAILRPCQDDGTKFKCTKHPYEPRCSCLKKLREEGKIREDVEDQEVDSQDVDDMASLLETLPDDPAGNATAPGYEQLDFPFNPALRAVTDKCGKNGFSAIPDKLVPTLGPDERPSCGGHYRIIDVCDAVVYLENPHGAQQRLLQKIVCTNGCKGCEREFDGTHLGLWKHDNHNFVSLSMMYMALELVLGGCAIKGFYERVLEGWYSKFYTSKEPLFGLTKWRYIFSTFCHSLKVHCSLVCPICGDEPDMLACDGTGTCLVASRYHGATIKTRNSQLEIPQSHSRLDRCFINEALTENRSQRSQLITWLKELQTWARPEKDSKKESLPAPAYNEYMTRFGMKPFYEWIVRERPTLNAARRQALSNFLRSLASDSAALAYFPEELIGPVRSICDVGESTRTISATTRRLMQSVAPDVAGLVDCFASSEEGDVTLPVIADVDSRQNAGNDVAAVDTLPGRALIGILDRLATRAEACCAGPGIEDIPLLSEPRVPSAESKEALASGICTGLPQLRQRPTYAADGAKTSVANNDCRKNFTNQRDKTGGIFTWHCKHGVCYAFYIIDKAENRDEPFSFLTCYLKKAPKVVVYDFACALQEYCLNRLPGFFKNTRFVVDAFHWDNHKACSPSFNCKRYRDLREVNSSVCEQHNSALRVIKPSATRSKQAQFMLLLLLFTSAWNSNKIERAQSKFEKAQEHRKEIEKIRLNVTAVVAAFSS